ncbi:hypothetical protein EMCRGX_G009921 [Ephydatia muelleri]
MHHRTIMCLKTIHAEGQSSETSNGMQQPLQFSLIVRIKSIGPSTERCRKDVYTLERNSIQCDSVYS